MDRRRFIKLCGTTAALAGLQGARVDTVCAAELKTYARVKLVDDKGAPLKAAALSTAEAYIFHYPFKGTPCFLINLGAKPAGEVALTCDDGDYVWKGGVGAKGTVVAYSAICAHQLSYPNKDHTPISYYSSPSKTAEKGGVIVCCEHNRVYDPSEGGKMIATGKKATQPLLTIALEHDAKTDELFALGVIGATTFDEFFKSYKKELMAEYGPGVAKEDVADTATTVLLTKYTTNCDQC
jgi:arsenite oxidase small subunit